MDKVSIILSTRQCTSNNVVEVVGECEKEYDQLALYAFASGIIAMAIDCKGTLIPWAREQQLEKFCYAFRFESEEGKMEFLRKLV